MAICRYEGQNATIQYNFLMQGGKTICQITKENWKLHALNEVIGYNVNAIMSITILGIVVYSLGKAATA